MAKCIVIMNLQRLFLMSPIQIQIQMTIKIIVNIDEEKPAIYFNVGQSVFYDIA